jgi:hypothetical protein
LLLVLRLFFAQLVRSIALVTEGSSVGLFRVRVSIGVLMRVSAREKEDDE